MRRRNTRGRSSPRSWRRIWLKAMAEKRNRPGFATRGIHAGQAPDPTTGAIMPPIYATSTFVQSSPGVHKGFEYARTHNPTRMAYERCIVDLESGARGFAFASGLAAEATVLDLPRARQPCSRVRGPLRRDLPAFHPRARSFRRARDEPRRFHRPRRDRGGAPAEHAAHLGREARAIRCCGSSISPWWRRSDARAA